MMRNTILFRRILLRGSDRTRRQALGLTAAASLALSALTGCGAGSFGSHAGPVQASVVMQGHVLGGQQPVTGAAIQLYAASQLGYGLPATALIASAVTTDANGSFIITGDYTCPYPTSQVYLTATGGTPGGLGANANLALMAALGPCGNLTASTSIAVNELTTVASAYALSPFMSSPTQLSTSPTNVTGLTNAAATVNKLVNITSGQAPGSTLPAGATEPLAELNTLANILASCVNSNGVGGRQHELRQSLYGRYTAGRVGSGRYDYGDPRYCQKSGEQRGGTICAGDADFSVSAFDNRIANCVYGFAALCAHGCGRVLDAVGFGGGPGGQHLGDELRQQHDFRNGATTGTPTAFSGGGLNAPSAIAFDALGDAWVPNKGSSTLSVFTPAGAGTAALTANLSAPTGVAIDAQGLIWVTNSTGNSVTAVSVARTSVTGSTVYPTGGTTPGAVAINPR